MSRVTAMTQLRPFRFAVHTSDAADGATWAAAARRYEALGFSCLFVRDHFDADPPEERPDEPERSHQRFDTILVWRPR